MPRGYILSLMKIMHSTGLHLRHSVGKTRNVTLKRTLLQAVPFWIASIITGLVAVLYGKFFQIAEDFTSSIFDRYAWALFILSPVCFVVAWWLVHRFAPYSKGGGDPQVMAAIQLSATRKNNPVVDKLLSLRVAFIKVISSLFMALGGGAIGREGPTIQIAASIFKIIYGVLPKWWPKITKSSMLIAGAAAGVAATFNTPLGGIIFAMEGLTKTHFSYNKTAIVSSVIIAGLTAQAMLGPYLYLGSPKLNGFSSYIFCGVAVVALISGLLGSYVSKLILFIFAWKTKFKFSWHHVLYVVACSLIMISLAYLVNREILGSGKDVMQNTLFTSAKYVHWYSPILRITGPLLSFTTGAAGGIFTPALGAGASIGSLVASWFNFSAIDTNMLILSGLVGFLTGVTRSPFTSIIIVLEMADRHAVIFHLLLAGMISSLVSILVDKHSLYSCLKLQFIRDLNTTEETEMAEHVEQIKT